MTKENPIILHGIISSEHEDSQKEIVKTGGADFRPFIEKGYISWNFSTQIENILGVPVIVKPTDIDNVACLYLKAQLFIPRTPESKEKLNNIILLINEGRVGWGIEGSITSKVGNVIEECVIRAVSLTLSPANPHTYVEVFNHHMRKGK